MSISFEQFVYHSVQEFPSLYKETDTFAGIPDLSLDSYDNLHEFFERRKEILKEKPLSDYTAAQKMAMSQRVANHLFCVLGNGYKWENGFPIAISEEKPPLSTPFFPYYEYPGTFEWYPLSEWSTICKIAGLDKSNQIEKVHDSYIQAAINVLVSMLEHGFNINGHSMLTQEQKEKQKEKHLELAQKCLIGIAKKYPRISNEKSHKFLDQ